jgi:hypothetical protein
MTDIDYTYDYEGYHNNTQDIIRKQIEAEEYSKLLPKNNK